MTVFIDDQNWYCIHHSEPHLDKPILILVGYGEKYKELAHRKDAHLKRVGYEKWLKRRKTAKYINNFFNVLIYAVLLLCAIYVVNTFNRFDFIRCFLAAAAGLAFLLIFQHIPEFFDKKLWP